MLNGYLNVQLEVNFLTVHDPKLKFMRGVEYKVSLLFNDVYKIPIFHQIISSHKVIYNIFDYGIYQKPHSTFKSKPQEFHNRNIDLFNRNDTRMTVYFMGMHRDLWMQKLSDIPSCMHN